MGSNRRYAMVNRSLAAARAAAPAGLVSVLGYLLLAASAAAAIALPPGWLVIGLAVGAFFLLALDHRLGPLPAGLAVILALPYDRAANNGLLRLADIPVRPQDAVVFLALVVGAVTADWSRPRRPIAVIIGVFLAVGAVALVIGMALGNDVRDVLRDARWWFLYATGLAALLWRVRQRAILCGLLIGVVFFSAIAILTVLLPTFPGGLKARALTYDFGSLRMQFGNSIFLLPATVIVTARFVRRASPIAGLAVLLLLVAVTLSLTRTFVAVTVIAVFATAIWAAVRIHGRRQAFIPAATVSLVAVVAIGGGIALNSAQSVLAEVINPPPSASQPASPRPGLEGEDPLDRLLFQGRSGFTSLVTGRFATYANAIVVVSRSPLYGGGLGSLVDADYRFGGEGFHTKSRLPNVDNAYLTVALKAGVPGVAAFLAMLLWPLMVVWRGGLRRLVPWFIPAWLGMLTITMTQSFATTGYGPYGLSLLLTLGGLGYAATSEARARSHV